MVHSGRSAGDAANGPYSVTITTGDSTYSASTTFNWTIDDGITVAQMVGVRAAVFTAIDPAAAALGLTGQ